MVTAPEGLTLTNDGSSMAISPDGRLLAFQLTDSSGTANIYVRPLRPIINR